METFFLTERHITFCTRKCSILTVLDFYIILKNNKDPEYFEKYKVQYKKCKNIKILILKDNQSQRPVACIYYILVN